MSPTELCLPVFMSLCGLFSSNLGWPRDQQNVMSLDRLPSPGFFLAASAFRHWRSQPTYCVRGLNLKPSCWAGNPHYPRGNVKRTERDVQPAEVPDMNVDAIWGFPAPEDATRISEHPCSTQTTDLCTSK